jgi:hypothetical protein
MIAKRAMFDRTYLGRWQRTILEIQKKTINIYRRIYVIRGEMCVYEVVL